MSERLVAAKYVDELGLQPGDRVMLAFGVTGNYVRVVGNLLVWIDLDEPDFQGNRSIHCHPACIIREDSNMAGRGRPKKDPNALPASSKVDKGGRDALADALTFCAPGFVEDGEAYAQFAMVSQKWITTYNGTIMFGHPIVEDWQCLPHFGKFRAAFAAAGSGLTITQPEPGRLSVKGGSFRANVPCLSDPSLVSRPVPDGLMVPIDNLLRRTFENVQKVCQGDRVTQQAVCLDSQITTATDFVVCVQHLHGVHLPRLVIPIEFVRAMLAVPRNIIAIGFSDRSLTVWFEQVEGTGCSPFMRTQLYNETYPSVDNVFNVDFSNVKPVPDGFFEAIDKLVPFANKFKRKGASADSVCGIIFGEGVMQTHATADDGAQITVKDLLPCKLMFDGNRLVRISGKFTHADWTTYEDKMLFTGPGLRGIIMKIRGETHQGVPKARPDLPDSEPIYVDAFGRERVPNGSNERGATFTEPNGTVHQLSESDIPF